MLNSTSKARSNLGDGSSGLAGNLQHPWEMYSTGWKEGYPIGSMYAIYGNIYHQYTPNVSIYIIHGYTWILWVYTPGLWEIPKCQATKSAVSNRTPFFGGRPAVEEKKGLGPFAHRWKDLETWPLYFNGLVCWGKFKPESPIEIMGKSMVSG
jgi:hypothetical protein